MDNFFLNFINKMKITGKDLDSMLDSLPWKLIETRDDGTEVYECEVKE